MSRSTPTPFTRPLTTPTKSRSSPTARWRKEAQAIAAAAESIKESGVAEEAKIEHETESLIASTENLVLMIAIGSLVLGIVLAWLIGRAISKPVVGLCAGMRELADGNFQVVLPGLGRGDEVGDMAQAVETFKVKAEQKARDEAEAQIKQDQIAAQQRKVEMVKLADSFEAAVGEIIETVSSASTELEASAAHAHLDRRAFAGADHDGRGGLRGSLHQRAVGGFRDRGAVVVRQRDQPSGPGIGADGR